MSTKLKYLSAAVAGALLTGVAAHFLIDFAGYYVELEPKRGRPTGLTMKLEAPGGDPASRAPETSGALTGGPAAATAHNLVLLIGDGMGFAQVVGTRAAVRGMTGRLAMERLPVTGWLTTHSSNRLITDSGAGATALASGWRTEMGRLSMSDDGRPVRTLMEAAAATGKAVGLVTDSYLWDATPAAFASHLESRRDYPGVAEQMAAGGFDVLIGEEAAGLEDDDEGGAMLEGFRAAGYTVVRRPEDLAGTAAGPLLALFDAGSVGQPGRPPELGELATSALERLAQGGGGFALLVESEEPDTGSHRGDFERVVRGVEALDRAVEAAVDFARRDGRTLVVVTADHDTGGLALMGGRDGEPIRIRWTTVGHTGNPVPLFAYGPGSEQLGGVRENTEVGPILARLLGLELEAP